MKTQKQLRHFATSIFTIFFVSTSLAHAEVSLDGTLGPALNLLGPDYQIGADLGQQHGGNLFHSFHNFSLNSQESATFSGPNSVQNVISRVTGGNPSQINGLIRSTIPNADFYFLNPYGIMFGEGARLDVPGSFHASTADTLRFSDGGEFNARFPNNSLLTVAPIESFGFLTDAPAAIELQDSWLEVPEGKTLSLIGGDLRLNGKLIYDEENQAFYTGLSAILGRINMASVSQQGEVITQNEDLTVSTSFGNVTLHNSLISTSAKGKGSGAIYIRGGQFEVTNSIIENNTLDEKGKAINILVDNLILRQGSSIYAFTKGSGKGGHIIIKVTDALTLLGRSSIFGSSIAQEENAGDSVNITIEANQLALADGSQIGNGTFGPGNSGSLVIKTDTLKVQSSGIFGSSVSQKANSGKSGNIKIEARQITLTDGAQIANATRGYGKSGDIILKVDDTLEISGQSEELSIHSGIFSSSLSQEAYGGNAGKIDIKASKIRVLDNGRIEVSTKNGNSGMVIINANSLTLSEDVTIASATFGPGNGGKIIVDANNLKLSENSVITSATFGTGKAGSIKIIVTDTLTLSNFLSTISANSQNKEEIDAGKGGNIEIEARKIFITEGAQISSGTFGFGKGGTITIKANNLTVLGKDQTEVFPSGIFTNSKKREVNAGNAGDISIQANTINLIDRGQISTSATNAAGGNITVTIPNLLYLQDGGIYTDVKSGEGDGGNITINNPRFTVLNQGIINANTYGGIGGHVRIVADQFVRTPDSRVTADALSKLGIDGVVEIEALEIDIAAGLLSLSTRYLASQLETGCTEAKLAQLPLKEGFRKAAVHRFLETTWTSFYLGADELPETTSFSLTKPVSGCH